MNRRVIAAVTVIGLVVMSTSVMAADEKAQAILAKSYLAVARISSLEFVDMVSIPSLRQDHVMRVSIDGDCYRIEHECDNAATVYAFDGRVYQRMEKSGNRFSRSVKAMEDEPIGGMYALLWAYEWLFDRGTPACWQSVKNKAVWDAAMDHAAFVSRESEGGEQYDVLRVRRTARGGQVLEYDVYFATHLEYLPAKWIDRLSDGEVSGRMTVTKHRSFETDSGRVVLPLGVSFVEAGGIVGPHSVPQESVHVNEPIDRDVFTLVPTPEMEIFDFDRMQGEHGQASPLPATDSHSGFRSRLVAGLVLSGIVVAVFLVAWMYSRQRQPGPPRDNT